MPPNNRLVEVVIRAKDATKAGIASARKGLASLGGAAKGLLGFLNGVLGAELLKKGFDALTKSSPDAAAGVDRVKASLGNLLGRIGEAVFANANFKRVLDGLVDGLDRMSGFVVRNATAIGNWVATFGRWLGMAVQGWGLIRTYGVQAWYELRIAAVGAWEAWETAGEKLRATVGVMLQALGELVTQGGLVLELFGVSFGSEVGESLQRVGTGMQILAKNNLRIVGAAAKAARSEFEALQDAALAATLTPGPIDRPRPKGDRTVTVEKDALTPKGASAPKDGSPYRDIRVRGPMATTPVQLASEAEVRGDATDERVTGKTEARGPARAISDGLDTAFKESRDAIREADDALQTFEARLGSMAGGAITDFAASSLSAFEQVGAGTKSLGAAMGEAVRGAVAGQARAQGEYYAQKAVAAIGEGLFGSPRGFVAAAKFAAASAGFYALAGKLGGGGGGAGGGGGGGGGATVNNRRDTARDEAVNRDAQGDATVIFRGGRYDTTDPRVRRELTAQFESLTAGGRRLRVIFED